MGRARDAIKSLLIKTWPFLWATAIILGLPVFDIHLRVIIPIGLMALGGMVLDQMRERDSRDGARDAAELVLRAVLATRKQPTETGRHLVPVHLAGVEEEQSEPPLLHRSAG